MVVDKIQNNAVVVRFALLAVGDMVVPEVAFVGGVVGKLVYSAFDGLAIGDNRGHYIG